MQSYDRQEIKGLLPLFHAYAEGKTIEVRQGGHWINCGRPAFDGDASDYRVKPESDVIVAEISFGRADIATVHDGLATGCSSSLHGSNRCYVEEPINAGDRVRIVPKEYDEIYDKLVPESPCAAPFKHYEPRIDGELSWAWMREQGQEFADNDLLIPMIRDLGHWLVLAIDELESARATEGEPVEAVCDGNWEASSTAHGPIESGCKAFLSDAGCWLSSAGPEWQSPNLEYYDCVSDIEGTQPVEVNETTKQIRAAKPSVSVANHDGYDEVNHPKHYNSHPFRCECGRGVECIDIIEHFDLLIGNIIKYAWRAGLKASASKKQDLMKCRWYADRAVKNEESK